MIRTRYCPPPRQPLLSPTSSDHRVFCVQTSKLHSTAELLLREQAFHRITEVFKRHGAMLLETPLLVPKVPCLGFVVFDRSNGCALKRTQLRLKIVPTEWRTGGGKCGYAHGRQRLGADAALRSHPPLCPLRCSQGHRLTQAIQRRARLSVRRVFPLRSCPRLLRLTNRPTNITARIRQEASRASSSSATLTSSDPCPPGRCMMPRRSRCSWRSSKIFPSSLARTPSRCAPPPRCDRTRDTRAARMEMESL